ncbi:Cdc6/Cdc18 family protein [Halorientalis persicus]|nr:orc1/cdc6 family replication initiation protein [Halorientalis persicus]
MTRSNDSEIDPLLEVGDEGPTIWKDRRLVEIDHVPDEDRIVSRDDELEMVAEHIRPVVNGGRPKSCMIYGKTGTGKSLIAKHMGERTESVAERKGLDLAYIYVDCSQDSSETQCARRLVKGLCDKYEDVDANRLDIKTPKTGVPAGYHYENLWDILNEHFSSAIFVLDEIDKLETDDILMQLTRARESQKTDTRIGLVGICNMIDYGKNLDMRVKSAFGRRDIIFSPYDAPQLQSILKQRLDAFADGVVTPGTIEKIAALSAKEHGDARKAMDILLNAGDIANRKDDEQITDQHVERARNKAEANRIEEMLKTFPVQAKCILLAMAHLKDESENGFDDGFKTSEIREVYTMLTEQEGYDPLSYQRMCDLMREMADLNFFAVDYTGGGKSEGSYKKYYLQVDSNVLQYVSI